MSTKFKRYAALLEDGKIEIHGDAKSVVVRAVRDSDFLDWPDLEKPKKKRGRKKKVVEDVDDKGNAESGS